MAEKKTARKTTRKSTKGTTATNKRSKGFTAEEKAAMKARAKELKAGERQADAERAVLEAIAEMKGRDRSMAKKIHAIVKDAAPSLQPKTWYGMPAYANEDGKIICFFKSAGKFKSRYATFGFEEDANLDDGAMWPTSYGLKELTATEEAKIRTLVKKAVS
jgi:uncharacterized protein YdhG (YjbR/CyaY superfamily)